MTMSVCTVMPRSLSESPSKGTRSSSLSALDAAISCILKYDWLFAADPVASRLAEAPCENLDPVPCELLLVKRKAGKSPRIDGRQQQTMPTDGSMCVQRVA